MIKAIMGGALLGFATVDLSIQDNTLTVWLTSMQSATGVAHTNAVVFDLDNHTTPHRALAMICDRYVVLTDRTPHEHPILISWGVEPSNLAMLAKQTIALQTTVLTAFSEYRARPGKSELIEPNLLPVPAPLDQVALEGAPPQQLTLALANQVMQTWTAWLITENERVKRWSYMPGGRKGEKPALVSAEFEEHNTVQPVQSLRS
jgi:hypothetical protein